jgi:hypothetical protein
MQSLREILRNLLSIHDIEASTVNQPQRFFSIEGAIHPREQKCLTNPQDSGKHVKPPDNEVEPLANVVIHANMFFQGLE